MARRLLSRQQLVHGAWPVASTLGSMVCPDSGRAGGGGGGGLAVFFFFHDCFCGRRGDRFVVLKGKGRALDWLRKRQHFGIGIGLERVWLGWGEGRGESVSSARSS